MTEMDDDSAQITDALRNAVADALERKRRLGHYAVIWEDGKVKFIGPPEDFPALADALPNTGHSET